MTIKWGDPIECNGVRPDWLRGHQPLSVDTGIPGRWRYEDVDDVSADAPVENWAWSHSDGTPNIRRFKLPADHPAYLALARGFHPWSGGERAPDDWDGDRAQNILLRNGSTRKSVASWAWRENSRKAAHATVSDVIGYRKRVEYGAIHTDGSRSGGQPPRFDRPHIARIEVEGSAPVEGVFVKRMTEAEWVARYGLMATDKCSGGYILRDLGLVHDESRAERFTRETGYEVTEAVKAALNWKGE